MTESRAATHRGGGPPAPGVVKLLLDGQQRITSLYGVARGRPPRFFDGNAQVFTGLHFHLDSETFAFYQPMKMQGDPLWIDVTELMRKGTAGLGEFVARLSQDPALAPKVGDHAGRLSRLLGILDIELHVEEVTGADKTLDVVVDIFNRVNSRGTKLSKGDLALAKICADWPEARDWGTGIPLKANLPGKMSRLEVHHIFPKAQLYSRGFKRAEVNALANFCFLTKETNLEIGDRLPEEYVPKIEERHPGALASQGIPADPAPASAASPRRRPSGGM